MVPQMVTYPHLTIQSEKGKVVAVSDTAIYDSLVLALLLPDFGNDG